MDWPIIGILIPTFNRPTIVARTVELLRANLSYSGEIEYYVSEDSAETVVDINASDVQVLRGPQRGLGANLNFLLRTCPHTILMQMDDDHHLIASLVLDKLVNHLMNEPDAGWMRLMGVGFHNYRATLNGVYWYVDWESPGIYIPSTRPHIKHRRFIEAYGFYPEGLKLGATEEGYCHQCKNRAIQLRMASMPAPKVLVPLEVATEDSWLHVGDSYQNYGY